MNDHQTDLILQLRDEVRALSATVEELRRELQRQYRRVLELEALIKPSPSFAFPNTVDRRS